MRHRLLLVGIVALLVPFLLNGPAQAAGAPHPAAAAPRPPASLPAGLPAHLGLGVSAAPDANGLDGWVPSSGVPWDYAYQYLAGGVNNNPNGGWQTWNTGGTFPLLYANNAASKHIIPVFSYYMLLQSNGPPCSGCGEAQKDISDLNSPGLMASYFADFATLMQRLGPSGFSGTAIVQVEPDLEGYAEQAVLPGGNCFGRCSGQSNDPAQLTASVSSSGFHDVASFENDFRGFHLALLHLRDLYAPNVLMGFHVSNWATLHDIGSSTDPADDPVALGQQVAAFASRAGVRPGGYDLIFNDVSDRDAGYYANVYARQVWWDRLNVSLPNFSRWERYLGAITVATGRPAMVWQIPIGNQYYDTENNTSGHYQDNRVEYFLAHPQELASIGVIGLLFGAGNGGSTVNWDGNADGVTNPPSFCRTEGTSGPAICNNHVSTLSDDDGGYLRLTAKAYYAAPVPAPSPGAGPSPDCGCPGGYRLVASDGGIFAYGDAVFYGSTGALHLNQPIVGMAATPTGHGYWLVASDGGTFAFGDAAFFGSTGAMTLNKPIVGMASTPSGRGYWLVASDGGIFTFGDAAFYGSTGALHLNKPIVGMASTPGGHGYWLIASDGGIFAFGDAVFYGSTGALHLNKPIVGMASTPSGHGYWLVASDGGIFAFGDAAFFGSTGAMTLNKPIVGMAATPTGHGYWLVASDGGIFAFGDAGFHGSTGSMSLNRPVVGMG